MTLTEKDFLAIQRKKQIIIFDECNLCKKDSRLLDGLCCSCWLIKMKSKNIINWCGWCGDYLGDYKQNKYCLCEKCFKDLKKFEDDLKDVFEDDLKQ